MLGPFIPLAAKLGRARDRARGGPADAASSSLLRRASPSYDTRLLTVAALNGAFQGRVDQPVNYVNAPLIAAERGIEVAEERAPLAATSRTSSGRASSRTATSCSVAGTTIGGEHRTGLVGALGFEIEIELAPLMVFLRYDDVPGVIGRVGTLFGEAGVNIANMAVSRTRRGGKALMVLSIDSARRPSSSSASTGEGFDDARFINLG